MEMRFKFQETMINMLINLLLNNRKVMLYDNNLLWFRINKGSNE